ncbi:unnamed protein product [Closterium sp. NIES-54]
MHLRSLDAQFRAAFAAPALLANDPPMYMTLYLPASRLPDRFKPTRDHFLTIAPRTFTIELFEEKVLAVEGPARSLAVTASAVLPPIFEGCAPSFLASSVASASVATATEVAAVASCNKGGKKGGKKGGGDGGSGSGGGGGGGGGGGSGGGGSPGGSGSGDPGSGSVEPQQQPELHLGAVEVASAFPASIACTGSITEAASLSFTLDSGASIYFFCDCTELTPLCTPISVALSDFAAGPAVAHCTTTLPCPTAPSRVLTGYYTPSFSRNLMGVSHLHNLGVVTTFPLVEPVASCPVGVTGAHLATLHREPGFGLYSLHTGSHHLGQVRLLLRLATAGHSPTRRSSGTTARLSGGLWAHSDLLLNKPFYPNGLVVGILTWYQSEGLGFESQCVHFGHPSAGGCQRSTDDPRLILGKGYRHVGLGGYGHTDPLLNKPFYPNGLVVGILTVAPTKSSPSQRPVPVVSGGVGGAAAEGEGIGATGAGGASSGGAGGVGVEAPPVEDTAVSSRRSHPTSPPGFLSVPQFPPCSSLRPVAMEPGGAVGRGSGSRGAGAGGAGTSAPTPGTVHLLTHQQRLLQLDWEDQEWLARVEDQWNQQQQEGVPEEPHPQPQVQLPPQQKRVEEESRPQQQVQLQPQQERVEKSRPQKVQLQP